MNRFAYTNGNPISGIDPFGLMQMDPVNNPQNLLSRLFGPAIGYITPAFVDAVTMIAETLQKNGSVNLVNMTGGLGGIPDAPPIGGNVILSVDQNGLKLSGGIGLGAGLSANFFQPVISVPAAGNPTVDPNLTIDFGTPSGNISFAAKTSLNPATFTPTSIDLSSRPLFQFNAEGGASITLSGSTYILGGKK